MCDVVIEKSADRGNICWSAFGSESREGQLAVHDFQYFIRQQPARRSWTNSLRNIVSRSLGLRDYGFTYSCVTPGPRKINGLSVTLKAGGIEPIVPKTELDNTTCAIPYG